MVNLVIGFLSSMVCTITWYIWLRKYTDQAIERLNLSKGLRSYFDKKCTSGISVSHTSNYAKKDTIRSSDSWVRDKLHPILKNKKAEVQDLSRTCDLSWPCINEIVIGSTRFNPRARLIQTTYNLAFEYVFNPLSDNIETAALVVMDSSSNLYRSECETFPDESSFTQEFGLLTLIKDNDRRIIWVSGIHGCGTVGVYTYLRKNTRSIMSAWEEHSREHGESHLLCQQWLLRIGYDPRLPETDESILDVRVAAQSKSINKRIQSEIKVIIFDLGNVLFYFNRESSYRVISSVLKAPFKDVHDLLENRGLRLEYECGRIQSSIFIDRILDLSREEETDSFRNIIAAVYQSVFRPNVDLIEILGVLSDRFSYRLALASNTSPLDYEYIKSAFPDFLNLFSGREYLSFKMKSMKPDESFYRNLLDDLEVDSGSCLFIDDIHDNVLGATRCGLNSIQYKSTEQLLYMLRQHGVPSPRPGDFA